MRSHVPPECSGRSERPEAGVGCCWGFRSLARCGSAQRTGTNGSSLLLHLCAKLCQGDSTSRAVAGIRAGDRGLTGWTGHEQQRAIVRAVPLRFVGRNGPAALRTQPVHHLLDPTSFIASPPAPMVSSGGSGPREPISSFCRCGTAGRIWTFAWVLQKVLPAFGPFDAQIKVLFACMDVQARKAAVVAHTPKRGKRQPQR